MGDPAFVAGSWSVAWVATWDLHLVLKVGTVVGTASDPEGRRSRQAVAVSTRLGRRAPAGAQGGGIRTVTGVGNTGSQAQSERPGPRALSNCVFP